MVTRTTGGHFLSAPSTGFLHPLLLHDSGAQTAAQIAVLGNPPGMLEAGTKAGPTHENSELEAPREMAQLGGSVLSPMSMNWTHEEVVSLPALISIRQSSRAGPGEQPGPKAPAVLGGGLTNQADYHQVRGSVCTCCSPLTGNDRLCQNNKLPPRLGRHQPQVRKRGKAS